MSNVTVPWYPGWNLDIFFLTIVGIIALSLLVFGILTAYFGKNKARGVGVVLIVAAVILGFLTYYLADFNFHVSLIEEVIVGALFYLIAAIIGLAIGLLIFLGAIMKT